MIAAGILAFSEDGKITQRLPILVCPTPQHLAELVLCQMNNKRTVYVRVYCYSTGTKTLVLFSDKTTRFSPTINLGEIIR